MNGFEERPGARASFVLDGAAPVQTTTGASGNSRGAQVVGGQSTGGVVTSGMETNPGYVAGELGSYFEQLMAPQVERMKMRRMFEGYTRAQAGETLQELTDNDSPLSKIFGPSGFEQGAQFYTAQTAINKWGTDRLAEIDTLKRMPPTELAKLMADTSQSMMTGDPYADTIIQQGLIEAQGPVIKQVTAARYEWQQQEAVRTQSAAAESAAVALQQIAVGQAALSPDKRDTAAMKMQVDRFLDGMQKPAGMADESYEKFLKGFMRNQMANGNFYAVDLLRDAGFDNILDDDARSKMEDAYEKYGNRIMDRAASDPDVIDRVLRLDAKIETEQISAAEAVTEGEAINALIRSRTGVTRLDYIDAKELRGYGKRVVDVIVARQRRLETRQWQLEDREYVANAAAEAREAEAAEEAAMAQSAWAQGGVQTAMTAGAPESSFHVLATQDWNNGDITNIVRAYKREGWHSTSLANVMQAGVTASLGEKYTKQTEQAYRQWLQLYKASPAAANAYYGKLSLPLQNFHRLVTSGRVDAQDAYRQAFSNAGQYAVQEIPRDRRQEFDKNIDAVISNENSYWFNPWGRAALSTTSKRVLKSALSDYVAVHGTYSNRDTPSLMKEAVAAGVSNGTIERYGPLLWRNPRPTQPLGKLLGLQERSADRVVMQVIDQQLAKSGFRDWDDGDVEAMRLGNNLKLTARPESGPPISILVTYQQLKAAADRDVRDKLPAKPKKLIDPTSGKPVPKGSIPDLIWGR